MVEDLEEDPRRHEPDSGSPSGPCSRPGSSSTARPCCSSARGSTTSNARRRPVATSKLSLHGLVRHMAEVERNWFRRVLLEEPRRSRIWYDPAVEDSELVPLDDADWEEDLAPGRPSARPAARRPRRARSRRHGDARGDPCSLRWIYMHMIEEYARHNGHADLSASSSTGRWARRT